MDPAIPRPPKFSKRHCCRSKLNPLERGQGTVRAGAWSSAAPRRRIGEFRFPIAAWDVVRVSVTFWLGMGLLHVGAGVLEFGRAPQDREHTERGVAIRRRKRTGRWHITPCPSSRTHARGTRGGQFIERDISLQGIRGSSVGDHQRMGQKKPRFCGTAAKKGISRHCRFSRQPW